MDFEGYFRRWRFNHVTTVERVVGFNRGSSHLRKTLGLVLFAELWRVHTEPWMCHPASLQAVFSP